MPKRAPHNDPWAADLAKLRSLRWSRPAEIAQTLDHLLDDDALVAAARFPADRIKRVTALGRLLDRVLMDIAHREKATPPAFGRSLWYAGSVLLRRHQGSHEGEALKEAPVETLYKAIESHWRLTRDSSRGAAGDPLGAGTFKEHHQASVYDALAYELRNYILARTPDAEQTESTSPTDAQLAKAQIEPAEKGSQGTAHNIPPGTYLRFIPREQQRDLELDLQSSLPVTTLVGVGGVGKSSLARHIALRIASGEAALSFDAVVWVSDKASPGSTKLGLVVDQLADVLDLPGLKKAPGRERIALATQQCRMRAVLFVLDNANTVSDEALKEWLRAMPDPSRVLLTSREELPAFAEVSAVVRLGGFDAAGARTFTEQVFAKLGTPDVRLADDLLDELFDATGGNAKAIEVALGLTVNGGVPIARVLATFRQADDDLFTDLFRESWGTLDETARSALFALSLLPFGAATELLATILDGDVTAVGHVLGALKGLALVDPIWNSGPAPIYTLNALVMAFIEGQKTEYATTVRTLEHRTVALLREIVGTVGFCPDDVKRLTRLDDLELRRNIEFTIRWCLDAERWEDVIALTRDVRYWYYVRGNWSPDPDPNLVRAFAARALGDREEECSALLYYCNIAAKAENFAGLSQHMPRIEQLLSTVPEHDPMQAASRHVHALDSLARGDVSRAIDLWTKNLSDVQLTDADLSANRRWLGVALYRSRLFEEARQTFEDAVAHDTEINFHRAVVSSKLHLVRIDITLHASRRSDEARRTVAALAAELQDLEAPVAALNDLLYSAEWLELSGRVALLQQSPGTAEAFLQQAAAIYGRLGLINRRNNVVQELAAREEPATA